MAAWGGCRPVSVWGDGRAVVSVEGARRLVVVE
jgi:hypothetical protein